MKIQQLPTTLKVTEKSAPPPTTDSSLPVDSLETGKEQHQSVFSKISDTVGGLACIAMFSGVTGFIGAVIGEGVVGAIPLMVLGDCPVSSGFAVAGAIVGGIAGISTFWSAVKEEAKHPGSTDV